MKIIELSQVESETVERAFYEVDSYEKNYGSTQPPTERQSKLRYKGNYHALCGTVPYGPHETADGAERGTEKPHRFEQ